MTRLNSTGVPLSINGYVICQVCGKEVQGISKETSLEYAYCLHCRPSQLQENLMPSVPKPGQAKSAKISTTKGPRQRVGVVKAPKIQKVKAFKVARIEGESHAIPTKGKSGAWLVEIKASGGVTRQELTDGCKAHGLGPTMDVAMISYCKRLSLLKD